MKKRVFIITAFLISLLFIGEDLRAEEDLESRGNSKVVIENLDKQTVENLAVLGKVWGFLKYYHPAIAEGKYNWDYELFQIMPLIINSKSVSERNAVLNKWIKSLGEVEQSKEAFLPSENIIKVKPDLSWIEDKALLGDASDLLMKIKTAKRSNKHYYVDLSMELTPKNFTNEDMYGENPFPDTGHRLLGLLRYWNIIEYYFPYKYLNEENWCDVLSEFIPEFVNSKDELEYNQSIAKIVARINDTHAVVVGNRTFERHKGFNISPLALVYAEEKVIVKNIFNPQFSEGCPLQSGDIILSIDGKSVNDVIAENAPYVSASNRPAMLSTVVPQLTRTNKERLYIEYNRNGEIRKDSVPCHPIPSIGFPIPFDIFKQPYQLLSDDQIGYIYPLTIGEDAMPDMTNTKGIIIDFRSVVPPHLEGFPDYFKLKNGPVEFAKFALGSVSTPGLFTFSDPVRMGESNPNYYKGKIVILVNELTQSQMEFLTMFYRTGENTCVIGSQTSGADGDMSMVVFPGGTETFFSGKGVYYPDGTETQRIGIVPDIEVKPTIKGIKEGHDELLEKAIDVILQ